MTSRGHWCCCRDMMPEVTCRKLFLFLVPIILLGSVSGSPSCANETQYQLSEGHCCSKCPPGHYMVERCTPLQDTECRPCRQGIAYNSNWNTKYRCQPCRQCVGVLEYRSKCSLTSDALCRCRAGLDCATDECLLCVRPRAKYPVRRRTYVITSVREALSMKDDRGTEERVLGLQKPHAGQSRKPNSKKALASRKKRGKHSGQLRKGQSQQ
ncbi:tumor necrosis factor receptor superfamily member 3-like isoform X1 [Lissotriton helveticus]